MNQYVVPVVVKVRGQPDAELSAPCPDVMCLQVFAEEAGSALSDFSESSSV